MVEKLNSCEIVLAYILQIITANQPNEFKRRLHIFLAIDQISLQTKEGDKHYCYIVCYINFMLSFTRKNKTYRKRQRGECLKLVFASINYPLLFKKDKLAFKAIDMSLLHLEC